MRGHCIICAELFVANADISAITCGHTFHAACLRQWQLSGSTCPQCRIPLKAKSIISKLYFDTGPDLAPEEDPDVLRNAKDQLEVDLMKKKKKIATMEEFLNMQAQVISDYEKEHKEFKDKLRHEKDLNESMKMQLKCLSAANDRVKAIEKEKNRLAKQLEDYKNMEGILNGTVEEADEIIESVGGSQSKNLQKFCSVLKSELAKEHGEKKNLQKSKVKLEIELARLKKKSQMLEDAFEDMEQKDRANESLTERLKFFEKILREKSSTSESKIKALQRVVSESPAPFRIKSQTEDDGGMDVFLTPEMPKTRKLVLNKENDSPEVSSRSVAASIALGRSRRNPTDIETVRNFKIMKRTRSNNLSSTASSTAQQGYDGLGGHSNPDIYPTGETPTLRRKIKYNHTFAPRKEQLGHTIIID